MSVNEEALRLLPVKPIGVYGSKDDVVSFLTNIGCVDDTMSVSPILVQLRYVLVNRTELQHC
jgi:hypothetical protein